MPKRAHISMREGPASGGRRGEFPFLRSCWTHLSGQRSAVLEKVDRRQQGEGAVGILRQAAIAHLGEAPQALEDQEGMLDLGSDSRLVAVRFLLGIGQRRIAGLAALASRRWCGHSCAEPRPDIRIWTQH